MIEDFDEQVPITYEDQAVLSKNKSFTSTSIDPALSKSGNLKSGSRMMLESEFQKSIVEQKAPIYSSVESCYVPIENPDSKCKTATIKSNVYSVNAETYKSSQKFQHLQSSEYNGSKIISSGDRMEESLRNHFDAFNKKVFNSEDLIYSKDRNLISNNVCHSHKASQYLDSLQRKHRRETEAKLIPHQETRSIKSVDPSRADLRGKSRVYTSGGNRTKISLIKHNNEKAESSKRCRTAAYNSRMRPGDRRGPADQEPSLNTLVDYQICNDATTNFQASTRQVTRPSTMAQ